MAGARAKLTCMRRAKPGLAASKGGAFLRLRGAIFACILAVFALPLASWQPAFGQAQTSLEQIVQPPKIDSSEPMLLQADVAGADAVIGIRYDATEVMQGVTEVICYGTAVEVKSLEG